MGTCGSNPYFNFEKSLPILIKGYKSQQFSLVHDYFFLATQTCIFIFE
jgi:hypothetical protein